MDEMIAYVKLVTAVIALITVIVKLVSETKGHDDPKKKGR